MTRFYMTVGLPGSGKTSYCSKMQMFYPELKYHSSDALREELYGDASVQGDNTALFKELYERVLYDLAHEHDVVLDATNINYKRRMEFLQRVDAVDHVNRVQKICLLFPTPIELCLSRNQSRDRVVPKRVIWNMLKKFDVPFYYEGWDDIYIPLPSENNEAPSIHDWFSQAVHIPHDNPHHELSIGNHCLLAYYNILNASELSKPLLCAATLLHDIGKPITKVFHDMNGNKTDVAHYYHHENVGAYLSFQYTRNLPDCNRLLVAALIRWHMYPFVIKKSQNSEKTRNKFINLVGQGFYDELMKLHAADLEAH